MGRARIGFSKDPDPIFLEKALSHSLHVHGDRNPHSGCAECKRLSLECLQSKGLAIEDVQELIDQGVPEEFQEGARIFYDMFPREGSLWD